MAVHLSRQWDVKCELVGKAGGIDDPDQDPTGCASADAGSNRQCGPSRGAKSVTVEASAKPDELKLEFINDGAEFPTRGGRLEMPASLKDRVEQAGGALDLARGMGVTKLSISLPIAEASY